MLKILNNDKFTTAQNRHSLVSLKIPILNTLPVRAKAFKYEAFALTGRFVGCMFNPGCYPGLGASALSGRIA